MLPEKGHASEDAFDAFLPGGYEHGPWGSDVVLAPLNLCAETLDGIRNHSWSRPAPATVEGEIVSWADRIAYCAHDLEDAIHAGIVPPGDVPAEVVEVAGRTRREQLGTFVRAVVAAIMTYGEVGMGEEPAGALAAMRAFNYDRIYVRPTSLAQSRAVVEVLQALVEHFVAQPELTGAPAGTAPSSDEAVRAAVGYVAGMTDRYAFETAVRDLGWDPARLPQSVL